MAFYRIVIEQQQIMLCRGRSWSLSKPLNDASSVSLSPSVLDYGGRGVVTIIEWPLGRPFKIHAESR